ncbi:hypothetical protein Bhyg_07197 [Pseudolycoriella hygida]|uniref:Uncharacterized protein n=1 Tax=Pseudolycoriella hygida TaxID=35572 RepID=A0A9Q0S3L0_9DIPT|nr:hypothetical protein Bhyg_07197 [Pseudolycoriella hygida]
MEALSEFKNVISLNGLSIRLHQHLLRTYAAGLQNQYSKVHHCGSEFYELKAKAHQGPITE